MGGMRQAAVVRAAFGVAALALAAPAIAAAQSFQLQPGATPTPTVAGPVDPDDPGAVSAPVPDPAPGAAAPSAASAPPVVVIPPPPAVSPSAASGAAPARAPAPDPGPAAASPVAAGPPVASPPHEQLAPQSAPASAAPPRAAAAPSPTMQAPASPPAAPPAYVPRQLGAEERGGVPWWPLVLAFAALIGLGGWLVWSRELRHRARALPAPEIERPIPRASAAADQEPPAEADEDLAGADVLDFAAPALAVTLQATRMSATLVNAVLSYRLAVTNAGAEPLADVIVAGDMVAAHASRPESELLDPAVPLPELHRIAQLAPGESVALGGDIRLPLVAITPIRQGSAALFVPLARLRAEGAAPGGAQVRGGGTFVLGQPAPSERLQPFRLDLGPRLYSHVAQQQLAAVA